MNKSKKTNKILSYITVNQLIGVCMKLLLSFLIPILCLHTYGNTILPCNLPKGGYIGILEVAKWVNHKCFVSLLSRNFCHDGLGHAIMP